MTRIREPHAPDAQRCAEVHVASWKAAYRGILPDDYLQALSVDDRLPWWTDTLSVPPEARDFRVLVAEDSAGRICGFGSSTRATHSHAAEIAQLYLTPEAWGSGAADSLLSRLIAELVDGGVQLVTLRVADGNARARRFYERSGWTRLDGSERTEDVWGVDVVTVEYQLTLDGA